MNNGLVIVFTGDGKGKTSAALGIAMRAAGHKMYVSVVQFIKDIADTGEALSAERLKPEIEFITMGRGFVIGKPGSASFPEHKKAAQDTLSLARQRKIGLPVPFEFDDAFHRLMLGLGAYSGRRGTDNRLLLHCYARNREHLTEKWFPQNHRILTGMYIRETDEDRADRILELVCENFNCVEERG